MKLNKLTILASFAVLTLTMSACGKKSVDETVQESVTQNKEYEADAFETEANGIGTSYGVYVRTELDEEDMLEFFFKDANDNEFSVRGTNGADLPAVFETGKVYMIQHAGAADTKNAPLKFDGTVEIVEADEQSGEPLKEISENVQQTVEEHNAEKNEVLETLEMPEAPDGTSAE